MMFKEKKISSYVQENGSTTGMQPVSTAIKIIPMICGNHGVYDFLH